MLKERKRLLAYLKKKEAAVYKADLLGREIVRECGSAIKDLHAGRVAGAEKKKDGIEKKVKELKKLDRSEYNIAFQEYAELCIIISIYKKMSIPSIKEIGVKEESYILGLLDATGEMKRYMYNLLMKGDIEKAKKVFAIMDGLFSDLSEFCFSDRILPNFRPKQDAFRIQLEQARAEMLRWL
ncbi:MAG: hypothetical protein QW035_01560 [Candidatus Anstonellales archaeon]